MTPLWIFPAYPLLLVGPYAAALSSTTLTGQVGTQALDIIIGGVVCQGIGFMLSFMVFAAYIHRLMVDGLPAIASRPAMFISVGPAGFTVTALILMGEEIASCIPAEFMGNGELAGQVTKILAYWSGIWLWGLAIWFFFVSLGAHGSVVRNGGMSFAMTWYSWIFPNTALITATFAVAKALDRNYPIEILGCVMTCIIIAVWGMIFVKMGFAIASKEILWPRRQEDRDEEQWKKDVKAEQMKDAFGVDVDPDKMEIKLPDAIGRKKSRSQ